MSNRPAPSGQSLARSRLLWIGYWLVLAVATHVPVPRAAKVVPEGGDKVSHFLAFAILAYLGIRYFRARESYVRRGTLVFWTLACLAYAMLDEVLQRYTHRTPSVADFLADAAGVAAAVVLCVWRQRRSIHTTPAGGAESE